MVWWLDLELCVGDAISNGMNLMFNTTRFGKMISRLGQGAVLSVDREWPM